jgi:ferrous iron transport protein B
MHPRPDLNPTPGTDRDPISAAPRESKSSPAAGAETEEPLIALVGSANSGKTTLFNLLTGSHYTTVNYPGATVEFALGQGKGLGFKCRIMDTPGLTSLIPASLDEKVTVDALFTRNKPDLIVAVVDANQLSRHLYLVKQLQDLGFNLIIALTMSDLLQRSGRAVDAKKLSEMMERPVLPLDPRRKEKLPQIGSLLQQTCREGRTDAGGSQPDETAYRAFASAMNDERVMQYYAALDLVERLVAKDAGDGKASGKSIPRREEQESVAGMPGTADTDRPVSGGPERGDPENIRHKESGTGEIRSGGIKETSGGSGEVLPGGEIREDDIRRPLHGAPAPQAVADGKVVFAGSARARSDAADRILLHPVWGLGIFLLAMFAIFTSIFWLATPFMDGIDTAFGWAIEGIKRLLPDSWAADLFADGAIGGIGTVVVFLPQILILFFTMGYLEDSGYLARGAALVDKPLSKIGLNGKSFVPLLSGYACAIPAMLAARTIPNRYERNLTIFIIPLMSCSARLPVYTLLLAFITPRGKPWIGGLALTGLYLSGLVLGAAVSTIISKFIRNKEPSGFILELPALRRPMLRVVAISTYHKAQQYLRKAGLTIVAISAGLWVLTHTPIQTHAPGSAPTAAGEYVAVSHSYAAQLGHVLEPVTRPMGLDWRGGVAMICGFAAREVFVSAMALMYRIDEGGNGSDGVADRLLARMSEVRFEDTGARIFTVSTVLGVILFFMIALQCLSTVAVAKVESGGWRLAAAQLVLFTGAAYVLAVALVQGLRAAGVP